MKKKINRLKRGESFALRKCCFNEKEYESFVSWTEKDERFEKVKSIQTYQELKKTKGAYVVTVNIVSNGCTLKSEVM